MKIKYLYDGVGGCDRFNDFRTFKELSDYVRNTTLEQHNENNANKPLLYCYETGSMYEAIQDCEAELKPTKFNFGAFRDTYNYIDYVAFAKVKYTEKQAIEMARFELDTLDMLTTNSGMVRHRIGYFKGDTNKYIGWWLDSVNDDGILVLDKGVPVWVVSRKEKAND